MKLSSSSVTLADIHRLELELAEHRQQLEWYRAAGNRVKAVYERLICIEIEMTIDKMRRELVQ